MQAPFSVRALTRQAACRTIVGQRRLREPNANERHGGRFRQSLNCQRKKFSELVKRREFEEKPFRVTDDSRILHFACHAAIVTISRESATRYR
jgi:hypothetical protein